MLMTSAGCSSSAADPVTCGHGTILEGRECVAVDPAGPTPDASIDVADAGPTPGFDSKCDPTAPLGQDGCPKQISGGAGTTPAFAYCFDRHTAPGVAAHDLYGHCVFDCSGAGGTVSDEQQLCFSLGATCRTPAAGMTSYCLPR